MACERLIYLFLKDRAGEVCAIVSFILRLLVLGNRPILMFNVVLHPSASAIVDHWLRAM